MKKYKGSQSIKSKSRTRFSDAIPTTNTEKPIPTNPLEWMKPIPEPKKDIM